MGTSKNSKSQKTNFKQIPNSKIQITETLVVIDILYFGY